MAQAPERMSAAGKLVLSISSGIQASTPIDDDSIMDFHIFTSTHCHPLVLDAVGVAFALRNMPLDHSIESFMQVRSLHQKSGSRHPRSFHPRTSSSGTGSAKATPSSALPLYAAQMLIQYFRTQMVTNLGVSIQIWTGPTVVPFARLQIQSPSKGGSVYALHTGPLDDARVR